MAITIRNDVDINVSPKDLFRKINLKDQKVDIDIEIPDSFYLSLLEEFFEREYLSEASEHTFNVSGIKKYKKIEWVQIERLPIHPNQNANYDLLTRWQGALSCLHTWGYKLVFLLLRSNGKTRIFLGTVSDKQNINSTLAVEQIREATFGSMPGVGLRSLTKDEELELSTILRGSSNDDVNCLTEIGAITGIPSFINSENGELIQTLDQLAFGIRDHQGQDRDYALMVIADPIMDQEISRIISRYRSIGSQIHTAVKTTVTEGSSLSSNKGSVISGGLSILGSVLGTTIGASAGNAFIGANIGTSLAAGIGSILGISTGKSAGGSTNVNTEFLDQFAEYAEQMTQMNIKRLMDGRNFGFWNTGVYVLGAQPKDITTVTGMLRSIYSGDQTYLEPIRIHHFKNKDAARQIVCGQFDLLPLVDVDLKSEPDRFREYGSSGANWHILGERYQYVSTPINTKELSLTTSLPRQDVPGLRFVKTAVRFANNPSVCRTDSRISIGNLVDMGIVHGTTYDIDVNSLVRHALVAGSTGSGKSTTCKKILNEVLRRDVPMMIIEPAKDDYVRWALEMNKGLPPEKQFRIFMPGVTEFEGTKVEELKINGYQPACIKGGTADLLQHSEIFATLLNACLPSEDVISILIEEVVHATITEAMNASGIDIETEFVSPEKIRSYPTIDDMLDTAKNVMARKQYGKENKDNLTEILTTRFRSLSRGMRGKIMNVPNSVDFDDLFSSNVIVNVSRLSGTKDKAIMMSLLMNALYEYRISKYTFDNEYRARAQRNELLHICLIEEAHNVLLKPHDSGRGGSPQSAAADLFGNMLSEVRGYGQGFIIVDQVPTRLIDDVIKNTNYKIVHRLTAPDDQKVMASCMAFRDDQQYMIPALEKGNAIIFGDEDDAAVWVKIPAPNRS
ncbi:MAG: DUF87 domain-containing protein [Ruminococcus sp.]|nr:DUF87 domain-containing protein [Ruminococcus sp.]